MRRTQLEKQPRPSAGRRRARRPLLETVERRIVLSTFTVWNTADDGEGSLRWAIVEANRDDGPTRIEFDIPGEGAQTIRLNAALAPLVRPVVIDGRSQPGYDGFPLIRLDGSSLAPGTDGLVVAGGNSLIAGLVVTGFPGAGIMLAGASGNLVESSYVGVDPSGGRASANGEGVLILGSSYNTIGGASAGNLISGNLGAGIRIASAGGESLGNRIIGNRIGTDSEGETALGNRTGGVLIAGGGGNHLAGNLISGNRGAGITLTGRTADNAIVGNVIGLTADGARRLGNLGDGVLIDSAPGNQIGGLSTDQANQISGNQGSGVRTRNDSAGLVVQGNQIGTDASGSRALGNLGDGVTLGTSRNLIGGESSGAGNVIAHNGVGSVGSGVRLVGQVDGNAILSNAIYDNADLGINLGHGPTPNRVPDNEPGPNNWQNYPVLSSAFLDGTTAKATAQLHAAPSRTYLIQLFQSDRPDASGFGEGQRPIGSLRVSTDAKGLATFTIEAPSTLAGGYLSATATDPDGNTSEFSNALPAVLLADLSVSMKATPDRAEPGAPITFTATVTNRGNLNANRVVLSAAFPSTASLVSVQATRGETVLDAGSTVLAKVGSLAPGESVVLNIVVRSSTDFQGGLVGTVRATLDETDARPDDNEARASVLIVPPVVVPPAEPLELSLTIRPPTEVYEQSTFQYALVIANTSSRDASGVSVASALPPGLEFVSASTSWGAEAALDSGRVVAALENLAAGESATLTVLVRPTASAGAKLPLSGALACAELDPASDGRSARMAAKVLPAVDLRVQLRPQRDSIPLGDGVYWVADVWNLGPSAASGVVLRLPFPTAGGFSATAASQGDILTTADGLSAFLGTIAPGSFATVAALLRPGAPGVVSLVASVDADQHDLNPADNASEARLSVFDWPGLIQFGASSLEVPETIGVATIPVERSGGFLGAVSIRYRTAGGSAIPGVDYQPVSGVLTFGPGETLKHISAPILANPHRRGDVTVGLVLESPANGAILGERSAIPLTIRDLDPDFVPPQVLAVRLNGDANAITSLTITFSERLNPGTSLNGAAYRLVDLGPGGVLKSAENQSIGLYPPSYDPATQTITLTPLAPLAAGRHYAIILAGEGPNALTDLAGNPLAGNSDGIAGADFVSLFARGESLSYTDSKGNLVSLRATGGGFLDLTRTAAGDARVLTLQGGVPGWTTLSGSVLGQRGRGDGVTTIDAIEGLGQFGQIRVTLSSPPFLVKQLPFNLNVGRPLPSPALVPPPRPPAPIRRLPAPIRRAPEPLRRPPAPVRPTSIRQAPTPIRRPPQIFANARPTPPVRPPILAPRFGAPGASAMRRR